MLNLNESLGFQNQPLLHAPVNKLIFGIKKRSFRTDSTFFPKKMHKIWKSE